MNSVRIKVPVQRRTRKTSSSAHAVPLAVGALLTRLSVLEERIQALERKSLKANGHTNGHTNGAVNGAINGHVNGKAKNGKSVNGKNGHGLDTKIVAVISSAIATMIDKPHRILSLAPIEVSSGHSACPWALHGRLSQHQMRVSSAWLRR